MTEEELKEQIVNFVRTFSLEVMPHDEELLPDLRSQLVPGTTVYVAFPPRARLHDVVRVSTKVQRLGLRACPHIVARALESEHTLRLALAELRDAGIAQILLVGGDQKEPVGPFPNTLQVLETGAIVDSSITTVAVAGHPEGSRVVGPSLLWESLREKQAFAKRTGTEVYVVTQFGFNPQAILEWEQHCSEHGISLPVHVGLAGPTPLPTLIRYAMHCGIGASLNALMKKTSALVGLVRVATTPDEMLIGLVRGRATPDVARIVKPHFFCFGGCVMTARWIRAVIKGSFEVEKDGSRFALST
jgi:methylenetetrahydrofolate reductase (NADPH)